MAFYAPDRYQAQPLEWLGNQLKRLGGGAALTATTTVGYYAWAGEYPYKWPIGAVLVLGYLAWELISQRKPDGKRDWKDVVDDVLVWTYGVAFVLWPLSEVRATMLTLDLDLAAFWTMVAIIATHAIFGAGARLVQLIRERS